MPLPPQFGSMQRCQVAGRVVCPAGRAVGAFEPRGEITPFESCESARAAEPPRVRIYRLKQARFLYAARWDGRGD
jgi:hypothetical protein